jgi:hypothetical protein
MRKKTLRWELLGFLFILAAGLPWHFVFEWTGGWRPGALIAYPFISRPSLPFPSSRSISSCLKIRSREASAFRHPETEGPRLSCASKGGFDDPGASW